MQCRNALRQHVATCTRPRPRPQSANDSDHLWISDALLAEAFARFVRVSRTSRRHESNVPGTLEARKRLAKRRYGYLSDAANVEHNNAALVPFLQRQAPRATGVFSWEPPNAPSITYNVHDEQWSGERPGEQWWPPPWMNPVEAEPEGDHHSGQPHDRNVQHGERGEWTSEPSTRIHDHEDAKPSTLSPKRQHPDVQHNEEIHIQGSTIGDTTHAAPDSATKVKSLLDKIQARSIYASKLRPVMRLMLSGSDDGAESIMIVLGWLESRKIETAVLASICHAISKKLGQRAFTAYELSLIISSLPKLVRNSILHGSKHEYAIILESINGIMHHVIGSRQQFSDEELMTIFEQHLLTCIPAAREARRPNHESCVFAIRLLCDLANRRGFSMILSHDIVAQIGRLLAALPYNQFWNVLGETPDQAEQLLNNFTIMVRSVDDKTLTWAVIQNLFDRLNHDPNSSETIARVNFWLRCTREAGRYTFDGRPADAVCHDWRVYQLLARYYDFGVLRALTWAPQQHLATALLVGWAVPHAHLGSSTSTQSSVRDTTLPKELMKGLVQIQQAKDNDYSQTQPVATMIRYLQQNDMPYEPMMKMIVQASWSITLRYDIFRQIQASSLVSIPEEIVTLMVQELVTGGWLTKAVRLYLERSRDNNEQTQVLIDAFVSTAKTETSSAPGLLRLLQTQSSSLHVSARAHAFVEKLASAFAHDEELSARESFKRVRQCYLWLKSRSVVMTPRISRAMLHAVTIRPLQERGFMSTQQVAYALKAIECIEGAELVHELEPRLTLLHRRSQQMCREGRDQG